MNSITYPTTSRPVPFVSHCGPLTASIALIGEAPGADEVRLNQPFVGKAGQFLDVLLAKAGIDRRHCFITNVVKVRPPNNDLTRLGELGTSIEEWIPSLLQELINLPNLKVIVPMGAKALLAVTELTSIYKYRGSIMAYTPKPGVWTVPTLHPSHVMQRDYKMHMTMTHDLMKAQSISTVGFTRRERTLRIRPSLSEALGYIQQCKRSKAFSWDLETFDEQIACIGLGLSAIDAMCIPFKSGYSNYWSEGDERLIWSELGELFDSPTVVKVAHNAFGFDNFFLSRIYGSQPRAPQFDTRLAHAVVMPELSHKLDFLTSVYTDMEYYKDDTKSETTGKRFDRSRSDVAYFDKLFLYNCKDCVATFEVYEQLQEELSSLGMTSFFAGYIQPLYRALFDISLKGASVDINKMSQLREKLSRRVSKYENYIQAKLGYVPNPKSPKQMIKFLYDDLKLPKKYLHDKKTNTRRLTTNADAIEALITELVEQISERLTTGKTTANAIDPTSSQVLQAFLRIREHSKTIGTYLNPEKLDPDGRLRTSWGVTETGRLSSSGKLDGTGMNLQNIPEDVREIFIVEEGEEMSEDDLSQAEARAVAALANCAPMLHEFSKPKGDIFKFIASMIYNCAVEDVTPEQRTKCKRLVHSVHYGASDSMNAKMMGLSLQETTALKSAYFSIFGEIRRWQETTRLEVAQTRRLTTCFGRVRVFCGRVPMSTSSNDFGADTYKEALAHAPQSTVGDITNQGLLKLHHLWRGSPKRVVFQVHDSIIKVYPKALRAAVKDDVQWALSKPLSIKGVELLIPVETKVGPHWGQLTKL